jgi:hypothetical protein
MGLWRSGGRRSRRGTGVESEEASGGRREARVDRAVGSEAVAYPVGRGVEEKIRSPSSSMGADVAVGSKASGRPRLRPLDRKISRDLLPEYVRA